LADTDALRKTRYEAVWDAALVRCREILDEDDYEALTRYQNASQLIAEIQQLETQCRESAIARLLNRIQPHLTRISVFVMFVLLNLGPSNISAACIWGSFNLLILVSDFVCKLDCFLLISCISACKRFRKDAPRNREDSQ